MSKYLNFSLGPVSMFKNTLKIASKQNKYFRTEDFSKLMLENKQLFIESLNGKTDDEVIFLTGSGTLGMEATVKNFINNKSRVLVVNCGTFGQRFYDIVSSVTKKVFQCKDVANEFEKLISENEIEIVCIQACETSIGLKYNLEYISKICKQYGVLLIVDAISSYMADYIDYNWFDVLIIGSQKALALPAGMSFIYIKNECLSKLIKNKSTYIDFNKYIDNMKRGQTPFTPAVSTCYMLNDRLKQLKSKKFTNYNKVGELKKYFLNKISKLKKFSVYLDNFEQSNCCTTLHSSTLNIEDLIKYLRSKNIDVCPNADNKIFRVGHLGDIKKKDLKRLVKELEQFE